MPNVVEIEYGEADMTNPNGNLNLNLILGIAALLGFDPNICTRTQYLDMERIGTLVLLVIEISLLKFR